MFNWLLQFISGSPWTYAIVLVLVLLDAFIPVLPGETSIITAGILAGKGGLSVVFVGIAAFVGVVIGDNIAYGLGVVLGRRAARRLFRTQKSLQWLDWARHQLRLRGQGLIIGGRFIPGARTAFTFAAGTLAMPWQRFIIADLLGAALFSAVYTMLGYLGGAIFKNSIWLPLLIALSMAMLVTVGAEVYRRLHLSRDGE